MIASAIPSSSSCLLRRCQYMSADGASVHAVEQGQGPAFLIVHPGLDDGRAVLA